VADGAGLEFVGVPTEHSWRTSDIEGQIQTTNYGLGRVFEITFWLKSLNISNKRIHFACKPTPGVIYMNL
jgi:hypothetical protein